MSKDHYLHPIDGHYVVAIDSVELQKNRQFAQLTDPTRNNPDIQTARYLGRAEPNRAFFIVHAGDLGSLSITLLEGLDTKTPLTVRQVDETTVPPHLKDNALRYFGQSEQTA